MECAAEAGSGGDEEGVAYLRRRQLVNFRGHLREVVAALVVEMDPAVGGQLLPVKVFPLGPVLEDEFDHCQRGLLQFKTRLVLLKGLLVLAELLN